MSHRVGEEFDGIVASVAPFGLFVELSGLYVDGLVHVSTLKNDYYEYDERTHRLNGSRSGTSYGLGDRLRVRLVRVNLDERKIDLELLRQISRGPVAREAPRTSAGKGGRSGKQSDSVQRGARKSRPASPRPPRKRS
jgi:ribonuclease R